MDDLLMIATLIQRLQHGELKTMAGLLCTQMKDNGKVDWAKDEGAMVDLLYDWAVCQTEAAEE